MTPSGYAKNTVKYLADKAGDLGCAVLRRRRSRFDVAGGALLVTLLTLLFSTPLWAEHPTHLDGLLHQAEDARAREDALRKQREQAFLAAHADQKALLAQLKSRLQQERLRSEALKADFQTNEQQLAELASQLKERTGAFGELFGTVRQSARDIAEVIGQSLVSAQYPGRAAWFRVLGESKRLPDITELERLWLLLQQEIVESGRVVRFPATVIGSDGVATPQPVVRVGLFNAVAGDRYLRYQPASERLAVLARQPSGSARAAAAQLDAATAGGGQVGMALDPTRGVLLGLLVDTPNTLERLQQGGAVGYVILALGALGLLLVAFRLVLLTRVERRTQRQLGDLAHPRPDNPLGRILAVAHQHQEADPSQLELQIDEAILRETPRLTRGEGLIKLLAGIAPLLGLLGTVVGMIVTFQAISLFGTGDPKLMANGISQALVTTALGLIVAIPLLFLHTWVASRSRALVQILDEQSAGLIAMGREG